MRTTAALAAVVLLGALGLWLLLPGQVHVGRTTAPDATAVGVDPAGPAAIASAATPQVPESDAADGQPWSAGPSGTFAARARGNADAGPAGAPAGQTSTDASAPAPVEAAPSGPDALPAPTPAAPEAIDPNAGADAGAHTPGLAADLAALDLPALDLLIPVAGTAADTLIDTFTDARSGGRLHDAIDIMAATGTPVLAVADGTVAKLFDSKQGGLTLYQFDATGALAYYYAHLDGYADGIAEGAAVRKGDLLGYVGHTGNAHPDAPHLHFAIFVLGPERNWWQGTAINPYPYLANR
jgi:murein DD-endopeptidase MepM/ murein hydrolase activator NlpD